MDAKVSLGRSEGNSLITYTDGATLRDAVMADINAASTSIHLQFFKVEEDDSGRKLASLMADKVAVGVETRLLYDDFVCHRWRGFYRCMRQQGIQAVGFNPLHWPVPIKRDYYRNHRKTVIIDGRVAYLGGFNMADRYVYGLKWGCWRDTMIRIEGPAVAQVQRLFLTDWCFATGSLPSLDSLFPPLPQSGSSSVSIVGSGPLEYGPKLLDLTCSILDHARDYVWFESPYFLPPQPLLKAFLRAADRGVDVRMLQPPRGDNGETTQLASKSFYAEAMAHGVRIGTYSPGFLHSKIIVSDNQLGVVGSCNIDSRSHLLCEEVAALVEDPVYAAELKRIFLADESQSSYIDPSEWRNRPLRQKLAEQAARTISNLL